MKLNVRSATSPESLIIRNTPSPAAQRLPFFTTSAGHFFAYPEYFTEREGLENSYLIFYTLSGCGRLVYRGAEYDLVPGSAAIINCFEYQYYATASSDPWQFKWLHFSGAAAGEYEDRINTGACVVMATDSLSKIPQSLDAIFMLLMDKNDYLSDIKISKNLTDMLTELSTTRLHTGDKDRPHLEEVEKARKYIYDHYSHLTGIDEIIGGTHLSKFYFLRLFKAYTGQGLYEFLNNHRVDIAKRLLKEENCKVCTAAREVGFKDVNCFIRYFKKVAGVTPAIYQKYYLY